MENKIVTVKRLKSIPPPEDFIGIQHKNARIGAGENFDLTPEDLISIYKDGNLSFENLDMKSFISCLLMIKGVARVEADNLNVRIHCQRDCDWIYLIGKLHLLITAFERLFPNAGIVKDMCELKKDMCELKYECSLYVGGIHEYNLHPSMEIIRGDLSLQKELLYQLARGNKIRTMWSQDATLHLIPCDGVNLEEVDKEVQRAFRHALLDTGQELAFSVESDEVDNSNLR